ncbi:MULTISPECIES: Tim44 domain-containing protein [unclassified Legionella]|uniref:Tim44 domain-containing protein n=1 Tax=unclassified Legionella TaxID=2622702 RepID=UPI001054627C|nr:MULTISPECIES: TIM44-like domain-containing protein [unclassified Legionella]MDI9818287.1 TIM44-like domain-containing protein [Legionella sp. PL877]
MRVIISYLLIGLLTFGLAVNEAAAKRFGGGRSFGVQRSHSSLFSSAPKKNFSGTGKQGANKRTWGGVLGGMLAGGLLASLFMGNGLGSGILSWLIIGLIVFSVVTFLRRRIQPGFQSQSNSFRQPHGSQHYAFTKDQGFQTAHGNTQTYSAGFNTEEFVRDAKVKFIRLQAAYDQKNMQDLTEFCAPEVFAEIKMQLEELGDVTDKTEVINLNAELLDVTNQVDSIIASVRFTGSIKEGGEAAAPLNEIWHFRKFANSSDWVVGGIQQEVYQP